MVTGGKLTILDEGLEMRVEEKEGFRMTTRLLPWLPIRVETFFTEATRHRVKKQIGGQRRR